MRRFEANLVWVADHAWAVRIHLIAIALTLNRQNRIRYCCFLDRNTSHSHCPIVNHSRFVAAEAVAALAASFVVVVVVVVVAAAAAVIALVIALVCVVVRVKLC